MPAPAIQPCQGLDALGAQLAREMDLLELPARPWVPPHPPVEGLAVTDVVIIGGGMCGLAAAAALRLLGLESLRVLDRAPAGAEGPWVTHARMETLRSPKTLAGPALGLASLTFRAWFEAQHGAAAWAALGKIPRTLWMDYLVWYRRVMRVPVENGVAVALVRPRPDGLVGLDLADGDRVLCRRLVLATGRDGLGGPMVPPDLVRGLPRRLWAHTADPIDFAALRGRRVGVVGAGASAMDNAAMALEAGCASLDMLVRRAALPAVNKFLGLGYPGVVHGFAGLPDDWKLRVLAHALAAQTPPPRESTRRVARHPAARLHLASPVLATAETPEGGVRVTTPQAQLDLDFLIFATGFGIDLAMRPELALIAPHIRFWHDRLPPDLAGMEHEELAWSPDLAADFSFQEKKSGQCPVLSCIHAFHHPASLSAGKLAGDIPGVSAGAQRLARGIARALFVADRAAHLARLEAFDTPELLGDEWPAAQVTRGGEAGT
jgi:cation diffusion facilitator CzcD-associated flavoprotein CzcO